VVRSCDWSAFASLDASRPGVVVAVLSDGQLLDWRSFGSVAPGRDGLDLDTPLYVASLAKQFTAACIGLLVLDGRLRANDLAARWLPELADELGEARIEHLLSHTSGLRSSNDLDHAAGFTVDRPMTTFERLQMLRQVDLEHEPGAVHRYSNHGYVLLAAIVERATAMPLGAFASDRIFAPLGMTSTGYLDVSPRRCVSGWANGTTPVDVGFTCTGDGGLISTVADLARWDSWLPSSAVGEVMLQTRPTTPSGVCAHNAWGISIRTHRGQRIESHGGAIDGYLAKHVRFPELGTSFIALANSDELGVVDFDARVATLADATLADHLDFDEPPWTETATTSVPGPS
jgi:CubicO group peptidase (beta-lactamase class C family)